MEEKNVHPATWLKAAAEIRDFLVGFKALQLALEEVGGLEKRTTALRAQEATILAAREKAEEATVAAAAARVEALKRAEADLTPRVVRLREETAAAQEVLSAVAGSLKEKQESLAEIEAHITKLRAKLGVS
jgi:chromosome segregation ATPase